MLNYIWNHNLQNILNKKLKGTKMPLSKEEKEFHKLPETSPETLDKMYDLYINKNNMSHIGIINNIPVNERMLSKNEVKHSNNTSKNITSDGTTASYYELPPDAKEIQDLISYKDMNGQLAEIGRTWYRYGECSHSDKLREINKIIFYAKAEKERLNKYGDK